MNKGRLPMLATLITVVSTGGMIAVGEEGTRLANLKQPPLNTTMMGVLKSAADYHGLGLSEPMIYGLSGHAFLINIHTHRARAMATGGMPLFGVNAARWPLGISRRSGRQTRKLPAYAHN